jgi:long-chain-fatty-acid--CoA ligase ACSBG
MLKNNSGKYFLFNVHFSVRQWTFKQYADDVKNFAKGLIALGLSRFGVVSIIGRNSPQWVIAALGAIYAG